MAHEKEMLSDEQLKQYRTIIQKMPESDLRNIALELLEHIEVLTIQHAKLFIETYRSETYPRKSLRCPTCDGTGLKAES